MCVCVRAYGGWPVTSELRCRPLPIYIYMCIYIYYIYPGIFPPQFRLLLEFYDYD